VQNIVIALRFGLSCMRNLKTLRFFAINRFISSRARSRKSMEHPRFLIVKKERKREKESKVRGYNPHNFLVSFILFAELLSVASQLETFIECTICRLRTVGKTQKSTEIIVVPWGKIKERSRPEGGHPLQQGETGIPAKFVQVGGTILFPFLSTIFKPVFFSSASGIRAFFLHLRTARGITFVISLFAIPLCPRDRNQLANTGIVREVGCVDLNFKNLFAPRKAAIRKSQYARDDTAGINKL